MEGRWRPVDLTHRLPQPLLLREGIQDDHCSTGSQEFVLPSGPPPAGTSRRLRKWEKKIEKRPGRREGPAERVQERDARSGNQLHYAEWRVQVTTQTILPLKSSLRSFYLLGASSQLAPWNWRSIVIYSQKGAQPAPPPPRPGLAASTLSGYKTTFSRLFKPEAHLLLRGHRVPSQRPKQLGSCSCRCRPGGRGAGILSVTNEETGRAGPPGPHSAGCRPRRVSLTSFN